jgi:uncharacterized membrane protein YagU involved in acid resistance
MAKASVAPQAKPARRLVAGVTGGLVGGFFFGFLLAAMGMLPVIAELVGGSSFVTGFLVHMVISVVFGALFGLVVEARPEGYGRGVGLGMLYGVFWWVAGAQVLMPLLLGGVPQVAQAFTVGSLLSLIGHLIYGAALGATVVGMLQHQAQLERAR